MMPMVRFRIRPIDRQPRRTTGSSRPPNASLAWCNTFLVVMAAIALVAACVVLSYSVLMRALFHSPNYWQDEAAVFLLVGATFMTAAYVQQQRGHIGIEAFVGLLSPLVNRIRLCARLGCRKFPVLLLLCLEILDTDA